MPNTLIRRHISKEVWQKGREKRQKIVKKDEIRCKTTVLLSAFYRESLNPIYIFKTGSSYCGVCVRLRFVLNFVSLLSNVQVPKSPQNSDKKESSGVYRFSAL